MAAAFKGLLAARIADEAQRFRVGPAADEHTQGRRLTLFNHIIQSAAPRRPTAHRLDVRPIPERGELTAVNCILLMSKTSGAGYALSTASPPRFISGSGLID